jgi:ABC-type amino acid transport substrate-binding protein
LSYFCSTNFLGAKMIIFTKSHPYFKQVSFFLYEFFVVSPVERGALFKRPSYLPASPFSIQGISIWKLLPILISFLFLIACNKQSPLIVILPEKFIGENLVIEWQYQPGLKKGETYQITILQNDKNKRFIEKDITKTIHTFALKLDFQGPLEVQVAILSPEREIESRSEKAVVEAYINSVERIKATQKLLVGVHIDNVVKMFSYYTLIKGFQGFDIDLVKKIAKELEKEYGLKKIELEYHRYKWPEILEIFFQCKAHQIDFAIASISIKEKRQMQGMRFSIPYYTTSISAIYKIDKADELGFNQYDKIPIDLLKKVKKIGAHNGTTAVDFFNGYIKSENSVLREAKSNADLIQFLEEEEVDVFLYDLDRALAHVEAHKDYWQAKVLDLKGTKFENEKYGMAFSGANIHLIKDINVILENLKSQNELAQLEAEVKKHLYGNPDAESVQ